MATTTNYGWTTPDDTALVKDGASAIRTLGTAIDTTVFNNASAGIPKTIVDAKGDIIAATAADTVSRLAVGANDTVLTADSTAATGLKWATVAGGGMTLLSTTTLSGASVTVSSIAQTYQHLYISITGLTTSPAVTGFIIEPNSDVNSVNVLRLIPGGSTTRSVLQMGVNTITSSADNVALALTIENYTSTTTAKTVNYYGTQDAVEANILSGVYLNTSAAVTEVKFKVSNALNPFNSGTVKIYGVK
jgi:hypothetical protein